MKPVTALSASSLVQSFHAPSEVRYCAIALYAVGKAEPFWLQQDGRIIIFDSKANAQDIIELMSEGRDTNWSQNGEDATYWPLSGQRGKVNRSLVITGYDVYNVPAGHAVPSETKGLSWKHHIHWAHWYRGVTGRGVS